MPNGVDLATFAGAPDPVTARSRLGLAEAPTVVCLGRLCRQKGQDRLVALWPDVRRRVPDARLVLVGDGPDRAAVSGREAEGVVVVGAQADPAAWLAAADVVVVPSRWEGMALAPLEAMATGRSVVGFDVVGLAESVPPGAGLLVPDGAAAALGVALADRLLDRSLAAAEGAAGRRHVATPPRRDPGGRRAGRGLRVGVAGGRRLVGGRGAVRGARRAGSRDARRAGGGRPSAGCGS